MMNEEPYPIPMGNASRYALKLILFALCFTWLQKNVSSLTMGNASRYALKLKLFALCFTWLQKNVSSQTMGNASRYALKLNLFALCFSWLLKHVSSQTMMMNEEPYPRQMGNASSHALKLKQHLYDQMLAQSVFCDVTLSFCGTVCCISRAWCKTIVTTSFYYPPPMK